MSRATTGSAGYDIKSNINLTLEPFTPTCIPTGLYNIVPDGYWGKLEGRSSLALKGIQVLGGVIDSDYTGEVKVILMSIKQYQVSRGDRIAQMVLHPLFTMGDEVDVERGEGGFGSTGK